MIDMRNATVEELKQDLANLDLAQLHIVLKHMVREIAQAMQWELYCSKPKATVEDIDHIISFITKDHDSAIYWLHSIATSELDKPEEKWILGQKIDVELK